MTIVDAPFVGIAVPVEFSPISKAYWQTDASVNEIAVRFSLKSAKAVLKRAGKCRLMGVACKHCGEDLVVKSRGEAITEINTFRKGTGIYNRVSCTPCFRNEHDRRFKERVAKSRAEAAPAPKPKPKQAANKTPVSASKKVDFYSSWEWRTLRLEAIKKHGRACQCCGATPGMADAAGNPVRICVDHIKPLSKYWALRLEPSNLQILCDECNMGKGNWDETDFRAPAAPDEWVIEDDGISPFILDQLTDKTTGTLQ
jgi:hypothetical protein